MKTPEQIIEKYVERLFRHTEIISKENAIKAIEEYHAQFSRPIETEQKTYLDYRYSENDCPHKNVAEEIAGGRRDICKDCGKTWGN